MVDWRAGIGGRTVYGGCGGNDGYTKIEDGRWRTFLKIQCVILDIKNRFPGDGFNRFLWSLTEKLG